MLPKDAAPGDPRFAAVGRTFLSAILIGPLAKKLSGVWMEITGGINPPMRLLRRRNL